MNLSKSNSIVFSLIIAVIICSQSVTALTCYECTFCNSPPSNGTNCPSSNSTQYSCYKSGAAAGSAGGWNRGCKPTSECGSSISALGLSAGEYCCNTNLCNFSTNLKTAKGFVFAVCLITVIFYKTVF